MLFQAGQLIAMCLCIVACNCRLLSEMFSEQSNHPQVMKSVFSVKHKNKSIKINSLIGTNY